MSSYERLDIAAFPHASTNTAETRFWQQFKNPKVVENPAKVSDVRISPIRPYDIAVSSSARIQILDGRTGEVKKTITRVKSVAYSADFRFDGRILLCGTDEGIIQVFDLSSRNVLRYLKGHRAATRAVKFAAHSPNIIWAASDDKTVTRWDMSTETKLDQLVHHSDYVRAITDQYINQQSFAGSHSGFSQQLIDETDIQQHHSHKAPSSSMSSFSSSASSLSSSSSPIHPGGFVCVSGSYDGRLLYWDVRSSREKPQLQMSHGHPVESVLVSRSGTLIYSAGDCFVKVFDILKGGQCVSTFSNHTKTITSLSLDGSGTRLMSASLDQFVKFYDLADYQVTHSIKYDGPILSAAVSSDNCGLVIGQADGKVVLRRREVSDSASTSALTPRTGTAKWFDRGANHRASREDIVVEVGKKRKLQAHDEALKHFHYHEALNAAIRSHSSTVVYSVLSELVDRDGLRIALSGLDEATLLPILRFLVKYVIDPRFASLLANVIELLLDIYSSVIGQSPLVDELIHTLKRKLEDEHALQQSLLQVQGALDTLMSCAALADERLSMEEEKMQQLDAVQEHLSNTPATLPTSSRPLVSPFNSALEEGTKQTSKPADTAADVEHPARLLNGSEIVGVEKERRKKKKRKTKAASEEVDEEKGSEMETQHTQVSDKKSPRMNGIPKMNGSSSSHSVSAISGSVSSSSPQLSSLTAHSMKKSDVRDKLDTHSETKLVKVKKHKKAERHANHHSPLSSSPSFTEALQ